MRLQNLPCEATLSNFRARLGEHLYQEIFNVMVDIFKKLEMITFKILSHDGTLFPTWARYKGCTYFCDQCPKIIVEDVLGTVRNRILYRLNHLSENALGSQCRVYTECPSMKEDLKILDRPRVIGGRRAAILVMLAAIFLLCKRGFAFIARLTHMLRTFRQTKDPKLGRWLKHPEIPKSIRNLIQRE